MSEYHVPIMVGEVIALLKPERGGVFVDGTLGGGGHAEAVLQRLPSGSQFIGIDRDADAIAHATERLKLFGAMCKTVRGNFFDISVILHAQGMDAADGILMDLGVSSHQVDAPERGFSYHRDAPLDMRMDHSQAMMAEDVVNNYTVEDLTRVIRDYGEERHAARIARAIVREREKQPICTTARLSEIVRLATPPDNRWEGQHPARRTFQALRIEVNGELAGLEKALLDAHALLNPEGRLAVITFHSLEDRIVKQLFRRLENPCTCPPRAPICICGKVPTAKVITRKPIIAGQDEQNENPRARSAKLRCLEKTTGMRVTNGE